MASLSFQHVYKKYEGGVVAVSDFNLDVADKEFVILVGPSGCGKSTTLRMLAGLEDISEGEIYIDDRCVNDVLPKDRDIAMVFQNYALYPHMSVRDNMAFALKLRKMPKDEINRRVQEAAKILEIEHLLDRKPKALSGGQRQRVALGRAIVRDPKVFLMDEFVNALEHGETAVVTAHPDDVIGYFSCAVHDLPPLFDVVNSIPCPRGFGNTLRYMFDCADKTWYNIQSSKRSDEYGRQYYFLGQRQQPYHAHTAGRDLS